MIWWGGEHGGVVPTVLTTVLTTVIAYGGDMHTVVMRIPVIA